jgi:hypothetical protein
MEKEVRHTTHVEVVGSTWHRRLNGNISKELKKVF